MKNFLKFLIRALVLFFALIGLLIMTLLVFELLAKKKVSHTQYVTQMLHDDKRDFVSRSFQKIPIALKGQVVFIIGDESTRESDIALAINKNYDIIAYNEWNDIFQGPEPKNVKRIISSWNADLPDLDIVMASFVFESYYSKGFNLFEKLWHYIDSKIKPGGYFIGNFFDPDSNIWDEKSRDKMSFLTKDEVLFLFRNYDILNFEEVKKQLKIKEQEIVAHYYEVFARKK
jgi:hypothetical protein